MAPENLLERARAAAVGAHCPYSNFRVGAAVEVDGRTFVGCNIENASYGLTVCAERVAIFTAVAAGHTRISRLAVSCIDAKADLGPGGRMPCGACRQVMAEFMPTDGAVEVDGVGTFTPLELLPGKFAL